MRASIKGEWVERLRSGEYEQGTGHLQRDGQFCCLGVLCEMAVEKGVIEKVPSQLDPKMTMYGGNGVWDGGILTPDVRDWAGLESVSPILPVDQFTGDGRGARTRVLAALNDRGLSFDQIADLIEEHL